MAPEPLSNSHGYLQMLEWTAAGAGPHAALLLHDDDGEREYAYDRQWHVGRVDSAERSPRAGSGRSKNDFATVFK